MHILKCLWVTSFSLRVHLYDGSENKFNLLHEFPLQPNNLAAILGFGVSVQESLIQPQELWSPLEL